MNNIANRSFVIFCVLFFLVNMCLNVEYVSAKNDEYQYDIQDENKKENISYEGVKENMEEVIDDQESVKSQEQIVEVDFRIKNYNDEEAYTEYIYLICRLQNMQNVNHIRIFCQKIVELKYHI